MKLFERSDTRTIASALSGRYALDPSLIWITFPFTVLTVTWLNWANTGGSFWAWTQVGIFTHLAMFAAALPIYRFFFQGQTSNLWKTVTVYSALGLVRGTAVAVLARAYGLESGSFPIFRPIGGALVTVGLFVVTTWLIDGYKNYRTLMLELNSTQGALKSAEAEINEVIQAERQRLLELISTTIRGPIQAIQSIAVDRSDFANREVVSLINETIDQRVKPLSQRLANEIRSWSPAPARAVQSLPSFRSLRVSDPVSPLVFGVTAFLLAPTMFSRHMSLPRAIVVALLCATLIAASAHGVRLLLSRIKDFPVYAGIVMGALTGSIAFIPAGAVMVIDPAFEQLQSAFLGSGATAMTVGGAFIAAALANEQQRQRTENSIRENNLQLAQTIARVSGQLWVQQRRIAEMLHGQVQSSLIVASAKLMSSDTTPDAETVGQLLKPIDAALQELEKPEENLSYPHFLTQLRDVWEGVLHIADHSEDAALDLLERFDDTAMITMTIIREVIGNAYRSGGASRVDISLKVVEESLELVVTNDGALETATSRIGLGTQLLRAATTSFTRGPENGVQTLRALIPVSRNA